MHLLGEMNATVATAKENPQLKGISDDVQAAINSLAEMSLFFASSAKAGKFLIPVGNAYPFLMMMGKVVSAWMLLWQADVASRTLSSLGREKGVDIADQTALSSLVKENREAAFYDGKIKSARYFIKNVLPEIEGTIKAIKSEDLSIMEISAESFA
jgi:hypothetical protein